MSQTGRSADRSFSDCTRCKFKEVMFVFDTYTNSLPSVRILHKLPRVVSGGYSQPNTQYVRFTAKTPRPIWTFSRTVSKWGKSILLLLTACLVIVLSGCGPTATVSATGASGSPQTSPQLTISTASLNFGSVAVNTASTQFLTVSSTGSSPVTVNSASISGLGFTVVQVFPVVLNPSQSLTLQVQFQPTAAGTLTGQLTISSNSTNGNTAVVTLNGTGTTASGPQTSPQLSVSAASLDFGTVTVNTSTTQSLTLTSAGTSPVTINSASLTGAGFTTAQSFPVVLNPSQSLTLQVQFDPTTAGTFTGQLTISSNSTTGSTVPVALSGTGAAAVAHEVDLNWSAPVSSGDPVAGYNIYRATGSGSLVLINSSPDLALVYVDSTVTSGITYSYVAKSVDLSGVESSPSNQVTVTVP